MLVNWKTKTVQCKILSWEDFKYVNPNVSGMEWGKVIKLVNELENCFTMTFVNIGCSEFMTVDIWEVSENKSVMSKPYKTLVDGR